MDRDKKDRTYIAIDLKSFFASVECVERGLDPLTTNGYVADASRTEEDYMPCCFPSLKAMVYLEEPDCSRWCRGLRRSMPAGEHFHPVETFPGRAAIPMSLRA